MADRVTFEELTTFTEGPYVVSGLDKGGCALHMATRRCVVRIDRFVVAGAKAHGATTAPPGVRRGFLGGLLGVGGRGRFDIHSPEILASDRPLISFGGVTFFRHHLRMMRRLGHTTMLVSDRFARSSPQGGDFMFAAADDAPELEAFRGWHPCPHCAGHGVRRDVE